MKKNKNLDKNDFYDEIEINSENFDMDNAVLKKAETKKISIIIPSQIFLKAKNLASKTGIGYQNTLKTAMAIGLNTLSKNLQEKIK